MTQQAPAPLPSRAALDESNLYIAFRDVPVSELQDAFLNSTLDRIPGEERFVQISREEVGQVPATTAPAGIVFHTGRAGSSLVSQLLRQDAGIVVYAEPLAFNELLLPPHKWQRVDLIRALRSLGAAFALHAGKPYVLKFTAWNALFADIVLEAFPDTPWVFNVRDPIEVGVSILNDLPGWYRNGDDMTDRLAKVIAPEGDVKSAEDYIARVYAALCDAVAKVDPKKGRLIDYKNLPADVWSTVAPHFGLRVDGKLKDKMNATAREYSKGKLGTAVEFVADSDRKQSSASKALRDAMEARAKPALKRVSAKVR